MTSGPAIGVELANLLQDLQTIPVGQPDIQQHGVKNGIANQIKPFGGGAGGGDGVAFLGENRFQGAANIRLVVDDKNVVHRSTALIEGEAKSWIEEESAKGIMMTKRAPAGEFVSTWILP